MSKTRLSFGEVAWDLIWRDRIRAEERNGRVRIPLERITGELPESASPDIQRIVKAEPKLSEVKVPKDFFLLDRSDNEEKKRLMLTK